MWNPGERGWDVCGQQKVELPRWQESGEIEKLFQCCILFATEILHLQCRGRTCVGGNEMVGLLETESWKKKEKVSQYCM